MAARKTITLKYDGQTFKVVLAGPLPGTSADSPSLPCPTEQDMKGPMLPIRAMQRMANGQFSGLGEKAADRLTKWRDRKMTVAQAQACAALAGARAPIPAALRAEAYWLEVAAFLAEGSKATARKRRRAAGFVPEGAKDAPVAEGDASLAAVVIGEVEAA